MTQKILLVEDNPVNREIAQAFLGDLGTSVATAAQLLKVKAIIDADPRHIDAAAKVGVSVCEVHTGPFAHAFHEPQLLDEPDVGQRHAGADAIRAPRRRGSSPSPARSLFSEENP